MGRKKNPDWDLILNVTSKFLFNEYRIKSIKLLEYRSGQFSGFTRVNVFHQTEVRVN